jgi:hypothetical protein
VQVIFKTQPSHIAGLGFQVESGDLVAEDVRHTSLHVLILSKSAHTNAHTNSDTSGSRSSPSAAMWRTGAHDRLTAEIGIRCGQTANSEAPAVVVLTAYCSSLHYLQKYGG